MGGQGFERREILRYIGIASVAATFPGFSQWAFACSHQPAKGPISSPVAPYAPLFFTPRQYRMIEHLAEMIIPADETPGAAEAGVAEFIDFMVANRVAVSPRAEMRNTQDAIRQGEDAQVQLVAGLDWVDARCRSEFGAEFMGCTSEQQTRLLEEVAYKAKYKSTTEAGREFFQLLRDYTVIGYYTSKIGLESLDYPGLRTVWPNMPGCTHSDREHLHLDKPGSAIAPVHKGAL